MEGGSLLHFHDKLGVAAAGLAQELQVRALLAHHPVLEDDDEVAVLHRRGEGDGRAKRGDGEGDGRAVWERVMEDGKGVS